jgi:hypothetical protein
MPIIPLLQNYTVLTIKIIIIFLKKKKKKNKVALAKMGWPSHPIFGQGVAGPPLRLVWGWFNHPHGQGGGPTTSKRPKKKKKVFGF